jgi:integrase
VKDVGAGLKHVVIRDDAKPLQVLYQPRKIRYRPRLGIGGPEVLFGELGQLCFWRRARPGELRKAECSDIDLDEAEWRFTVTKTKTPHIVPLSRQALEILRQIRPLTGRGQFVFPSARSSKRPMSDNAVLAAMSRMAIGAEEMSGHGFRAAARTILDEGLASRADFIEHQLAHEVRDPNGRAPNRTVHLAERKKRMQAWAHYLDKLKQGSEVVLINQSA